MKPGSQFQLRKSCTHWLSHAVLMLGALLLAGGNFIGAAEKLDWQEGKGHRHARLTIPAGGKTGFTLLAPATTGILWTNHLSNARVSERQNLMNGAGIAAGDFDGDGLCDLYFCNKEGPNALYRNLGGWKFEEVAQQAGVACTNQSSTGAVFADLNGDGRLDLLVNSFAGPNACFLNLGNGRFTNVTGAAGLLSKGGTTSLALGDIDGDGDLDLYVNYFGIEAVLRDGGTYSVRTVNGQPVVTGRFAKRLKIIEGKIYEYGEPDVLFLNDGQAHFTPVAWERAFQDEDGRPVPPPSDFGLAVQVRDINGDGAPDIYVCNDFQTPDRLWLNDGRGRFKAIDRLALRNMSYASMGVDFGDLDRDGRLDFIAVEMLSRDRSHHLRQSSPMSPKSRLPGQIDNREEVARNTLYWNRGDGTFAEIAYYARVAASDWSWTPIFLDVDLDGYEDALISNGHMFDVNDRDVTATLPSAAGQSMQANRQVLFRYPKLDTPNAAFRNRGDLTFDDVGAQWGFDSRQICHGMVLADLDNDGDQDVVLNCINGAPLIYRNETSAARIAVRLKGGGANAFGIGARIEVSGGPVPVQAQEMLSGGRYLSGDEPLRTFAAGNGAGKLGITVTWRDGSQSTVPNAEANHLYEIDQAGAKPLTRPAKPLLQPLFEDASAALNHTHHEEPFDDFARQPLLPRKFSQSGPGVAWCDLDGDGLEDLIIGSGKGGPLSVRRNAGAGRFEPWADAAWDQIADDDQTAIVGARIAGGAMMLLAGAANYESPATGTKAAGQFMVRGRRVAAGADVPPDAASAGPMALADLDGDGALELFIGGRLVAGRYPEAAPTRIFRRNGEAWTLDAVNSKTLEKAGLVSGAVFSDLDGDGDPDLVLACEWGPLKIFRNDKSRLVAWNPATTSPQTPGTPGAKPGTLDALTGFWNSVTTGDFDGDGRMDIVAGNWGLNSYHNLAPDGPWSLYHGDWSGAGRVDLLEAFLDPATGRAMPWRDMTLVGKSMPWVHEQFASHMTYSTAGVAAILGERTARATELRANTLASMVFLNRGDHFQVMALPMQAQWAPVFGLAVADADGDGREDLFLAQNFFAVRPEDDRLDAGCGLWLRGDGQGGFSAMPGQDSGVKVYGEQRGAAVGDYDADGRVDLVVAQNGAQTKLFHNVGAKPGLRVRLRASGAGNVDAIGAQMRLMFGTRAGAMREVRAGGGYWSQDGLVQVLAMPETPGQVWVRWPGGKISTNSIPAGAREITVTEDGAVSGKK